MLKNCLLQYNWCFGQKTLRRQLSRAWNTEYAVQRPSSLAREGEEQKKVEEWGGIFFFARMQSTGILTQQKLITLS